MATNSIQVPDELAAVFVPDRGTSADRGLAPGLQPPPAPQRAGHDVARPLRCPSGARLLLRRAS